jgi:hypothetical protein
MAFLSFQPFTHHLHVAPMWHLSTHAIRYGLTCQGTCQPSCVSHHEAYTLNYLIIFRNYLIIFKNYLIIFKLIGTHPLELTPSGFHLHLFHELSWPSRSDLAGVTHREAFIEFHLMFYMPSWLSSYNQQFYTSSRSSLSGARLTFSFQISSPIGFPLSVYPHQISHLFFWMVCSETQRPISYQIPLFRLPFIEWSLLFFSYQEASSSN